MGVAGERQAVDQDTLTTAAKFAKYAIAAYGNFGMQYKDENGIGYAANVVYLTCLSAKPMLSFSLHLSNKHLIEQRQHCISMRIIQA